MKLKNLVHQKMLTLCFTSNLSQVSASKIAKNTINFGKFDQKTMKKKA